MHWWDLLDEWNLPHRRLQGVTLVARRDAQACILRIAAERCEFFGFDALSVRPNGRLRVHKRWCAEWPPGAAPGPDEVGAMIEAHPGDVTHYEFVFRKRERGG